jgi:hypothetical protein
MHKFRFLASEESFENTDTTTVPQGCTHFVVATSHGANTDYNHAHMSIGALSVIVPAGQFVAIAQATAGTVLTGGDNTESIAFYAIEY